MRSGRGARIWDVDGNEYVDLMNSYGPVVLGHRHPAVEEAAARQAAQADCQNGPGPVMVELAELLVATVDHADWAMLANRTLMGLGIVPSAYEAIVPAYLWRFRKTGQFRTGRFA